MRFASLMVFAVVAAGCFHPDLGSQPFRCGPGSACPDGYQCGADLICRTPDSRSSDAGARSDATSPDGASAAADAGRDGAAADAGPTLDAPPCTAGMFLSCKDGHTAIVCGPSGGGVELECEAGCDGSAKQCNHCVPSAVRCSGDDLQTCSNKGEVLSRVTCAAGCDGSGALHACFVLSPTLGSPDACRGTAPDAPGVTGSVVTINTNNCTGGTVVAQGSGLPDLCVFRYRELNVPAGRTLQFTGNRIPAFIAVESMLIEGTIDAAGHDDVGGPATSPEGFGQGGPGANDSSQGGGGGGALTAGAPGGDSSGTVGGLGGLAHPRTKQLRPGGYGGIGGPCLLCERLAGGGGGGALYLVSCKKLLIGATARIAGGGGGGRGGGGSLAVLPSGGDGGGSGGEIFLEASEILIDLGSIIASNGGAGGGGGSGSNTSGGDRGSDGVLGRTPAPGGAGGEGGGKGGEGGTGDGGGSAGKGMPPNEGEAGESQSAAGGGGGSAGRLRFNTRPDKPVELQGGFIISPGPFLGQIVRTR